MRFYSSCWTFIDLHLIPEGSKWFYLSFHIHPLLLVPCQIYLWLKALVELCSAILFLFLDSVYFLVVYIYDSIRSAAVYCFLFIRVPRFGLRSRRTTFEPAEEDYQVFRSFSFSCQTASLFPELPKVVPVESINFHHEDEEAEYQEASMHFGDFIEEERKTDEDIGTNDDDLAEEEQKTDEDIGANDDEYEAEEPKPNLEQTSASSSPVGRSNSPAEEELIFPGESGSEEYVVDSTSPNPAVMWNWPESLPRDGDISSSFEEEESEWNEHIPSPYEHLSVGGTGMDEGLATQRITGSYRSGLEWTEHDEPEVSFNASSIPLIREEEPGTRKYEDPFYDKYSDTMRWFDVVCTERMCGISAVLEKQLEPGSISNPSLLRDKSRTSKRILLKSLENDFELVYVSQTCLSWEALHHHYSKVQELLLGSSCPRIIRVTGHTNLVGEFQKFQVLVERFLEDEARSKGKRYLKFVEAKFSLKSLLQVPELSGFSEAEGEQNGSECRPVHELKQVVKAIEKCMRAFFHFVKADNEKSWWMFKSSLWSYPPVEDPRDLPLLDELTRLHQKKMVLLKDLQGKRKRLISRGGSSVGPILESQEKEMLFAAIDLKLVARVLQMATVTTSQLKWCRSKLDNVRFREGTVTRGGACPLFPIS